MEHKLYKLVRINWKAKKIIKSDTIETTMKTFSIPRVIANFLAHKKLLSEDEILEYLNPSLQKIHNPFLMANMDKAVLRILKSINANEKILVYGDYDVDGSTAVAMLFSFLKKALKADVHYYLPDRYKEGYGLSLTAINWAYEMHINLIITLDCGITDFESIDLANNLGVEVIVCDHHKPMSTLPRAYAILNPKQKHCSYPFKELSGCAVGFKLIQAIATQLNLSQKKIINNYVDLLAISIACDIVPLEDENRVFLYHGLLKIAKKPSLGVKSLLNSSGLGYSKTVTTSNLVFNLGPRINAGGRIDHAKHSVEVLISDDQLDANNKAQYLEMLNTQRKEIDETTTYEALEMLFESKNFLNFKRTTVLFSENWHKGIIGIVASRCIEYCYRPTIIFAKISEKQAVGSARSIEGLNLYKALESCADFLIRYGGHDFAAGLSISLDKIEIFRYQFEKYFNDSNYDSFYIPTKYIDGFLSIKSINNHILSILSKIEPCGLANSRPIFYDNDVELMNYSIINEKHVKLFIKHSHGYIIEGFGFNLGHYQEELFNNKKITVIYTINEYDVNHCLSIRIEDLKFSPTK